MGTLLLIAFLTVFLFAGMYAVTQYRLQGTHTSDAQALVTTIEGVNHKACELGRSLLQLLNHLGAPAVIAPTLGFQNGTIGRLRLGRPQFVVVPDCDNFLRKCPRWVHDGRLEGGASGCAGLLFWFLAPRFLVCGSPAASSCSAFAINMNGKQKSLILTTVARVAR